MISEELINQFDLKKPHLMLANTISEEIKFMRQSLIPSLVKNIKDNEGKKEALRFFELSKVYYPQENDLPLEKYRLSFATNTDFFDLKGIIEAVLRELRITDYEFVQSKEPQFLPNVQAQFSVGAEKSAGIIGQLKKNYTSKLDIKSNVYVAEIAFQPLIDNYRLLPDYVPPNQYAVVKLDANIEISDKKNFGEIKKKSFETSKLLTNLELIDVYKNTATIRFYFTSRDHNITDAEAQKELDSIKTSL
jgi:phenylalanyl-tRNA synthetase beta chain